MAVKEIDSAGTAATRKALTGQQAAKPMNLVPEMGWTAQWTHGTLRHADGDAARLARLADVVRHLMAARELPFKDAVELICRPLETGKGVRLYRVDETGYARALDEHSPASEGWDKFLNVPEDAADRLAYFSKRAAEHLRASWLMQPYELARLVNHSQIPDDSDYQETKESPFEYSERRGNHGSRYAVTFQTAHDLWGWGTVTAANTGDGVVKLRAVFNVSSDPKTWTELVQWHKENDGHEWATALKKILADERHKRGTERGAAKKMADELEMTVSRLNELIRTNEVRGKRQSKRAA